MLLPPIYSPVIGGKKREFKCRVQEKIPDSGSKVNFVESSKVRVKLEIFYSARAQDGPKEMERY